MTDSDNAVCEQTTTEPETGVSTSQTTASESVAQDEAQARVEADKVLKATSRAFVGGEKAYRAGLLEAGRLADDYLHRRMALGDSRSAGVDMVRLELQRFASGKVDVNRLVASWSAYSLLAVAQGLDVKPEKGKPAPAEGVPYGHYKSAWCLLVDRVQKDRVEEVWVLLPGFETECRELYAKACTNGLSREACEEAAKGIVRSYTTAVAGVKAAEVAKAKQAAEELKAKAELERQELAKAKQAQDVAAAELLKATTDAEKATAAEQHRLAELAAKEQAIKAQEATKAETQAVKAETKAVAESTKATQAVERAVEREERVVQRASGKVTPPVPTPEGRLENLLKAGKQATVKDAAEFCVNVLAGHPEPDDVLAELLRQLKRREDMSRTCKRACDAALVVLSAPTPVQLNATLERANSTLPVAV